MSSLATSGARGAAFTLGGQGGAVLVRLIGLAVLARLVDPSIYGIVAVGVAISAFAVAVAAMGIPMALAQAPTITRTAESTLFYANVALGALVSLAMVVAAPLVAYLTGHEILTELVRWLAIAPLAAAMLGMLRVRLARGMRFRALAAIEVAATAMAFGTAIAVAAAGHPYVALVLQALVLPCAQLFLLAIVSRWWPSGIHRPSPVERELVGIGLRAVAINMLREGSRNAIVPALSMAAPPAHVGAFDRAQQLILMPIGLTVEQMKRVALPVLARVSDDAERLAAYFRRAQQLATYGTATLFGLMAALAEPVVLVLLGRDWSEAVPLLRVLAIGGVFRALGLTAQWLHLGPAAMSRGLRFNVVALPAVVVIALLGLPWGAMGVAVAYGSAWILYWPVALRSASHAHGLNARVFLFDASRGLIQFVLPTSLAAAVASSVLDGTVLSLAAGLGAAAAVGAASALVAPRVRRDFLAVWHLVGPSGHGSPGEAG